MAHNHEMAMTQVKKIPVSLLRASPHNPRRTFSQAADLGLGLDMQRHGQKTPCRIFKEGEFYTVVSGNRRLNAALLVGIKELDCIEVPPLTPTELMIDQLIDNQHESLTVADEADSYQQLMAANNWNAVTLAKALGCSESKISKALAIKATLCPEVLEMVRQAKVKASFAYAVSRFPTDVQIKMATAVANKEITEAMAKATLQQQKQSKKPVAVRLTLELTTFDSVKGKLSELLAQIGKLEKLGAAIHTLKGLVK